MLYNNELIYSISYIRECSNCCSLCLQKLVKLVS